MHFDVFFYACRLMSEVVLYSCLSCLAGIAFPSPRSRELYMRSSSSTSAILSAGIECARKTRRFPETTDATVQRPHPHMLRK